MDKLEWQMEVMNEQLELIIRQTAPKAQGAAPIGETAAFGHRLPISR
jgi:hypothetical protein